jgi:hypothetical protein
MALFGGLLAGILVGVFSGMVGIGGGVLLVPILLYFFGMSQSEAQGTSLAMLLPPTGLLAFLQYYRAGHANLKLGLIIAVGVFLGGWLGGGWAQQLSSLALRRIFAGFLIVVGIRMLITR